MDKIWLEHYPNGTAKNIDLTHDTLINLFDNVCQKYADNKAITCHGVTFSFSQTAHYVNNIAAYLINLGCKKQDRIAVILPNSIQYPLIVFAILKIGAIVVNINPLYTNVEMEYLLDNSGAKTVFILDVMAKKLDNLLQKIQNIIVTKIADPYPLFKRIAFNLVIKYVKKVNLKYNYKAINFRDLLNYRSNLLIDQNVTKDDIAFIQYTGATTGRPKGAILSHKNIVANVSQVHTWLYPQVPNLDRQVVIDALPLYHIFSLTANLFTFFFSGSQNVMIPNPRDLKDMLKTLKKTTFTVFSALDTLYNLLLNSPEFLQTKYPHFKYSVAGGMASRESVSKKWYEVTGVMPSNCYGLTEASPAVTINMIDNSYDGSVGFPISSTEIEIREIKTGAVLDIEQSGTIWVRGPQLMDSYWNDPIQTAAAFDSNGWFNTRDIGYINKNGKLFIVSRESDMIIVSGFNVYPIEVENVLDSIEQIEEASVVGINDRASGERVVAFIIFKKGMFLTDQEIIQACRKKLASYKIPHQIIITHVLPKTLVGKIDKKALIKSIGAF